jgi:lipid-binding SYLF domain-containing protein
VVGAAALRPGRSGGAGGTIDTETAKKPIIGFIYSNEGLMDNLSFEGSKITEIRK